MSGNMFWYCLGIRRSSQSPSSTFGESFIPPRFVPNFLGSSYCMVSGPRNLRWILCSVYAALHVHEHTLFLAPTFRCQQISLGLQCEPISVFPYETTATPQPLRASFSISLSLFGVWKQSSPSTYHQKPWNPQLEHKGMFYILTFMPVTTLKTSAPTVWASHQPLGPPWQPQNEVWWRRVKG